MTAMPLPFRIVPFAMLLAWLLASCSWGQVPGICTSSDGMSWTQDEQVLRKWLEQRNDPGKGAGPALTVQAPPSQTTPFAPATTFGHSPVHTPPVHTPPVHTKGTAIAPHSIGTRSISYPTSQEDDLLVAPTPQAEADPLSGLGPDAKREMERAQSATSAPAVPSGVDPHWEIFAKERYPSAIQCAKCHQKIYDEWRVSGHAYAAVSPMFTRFEQKVAELTRGTSGTFCLRCHAPVATQTDFPRDAAIFDGPAVFREGITCIACHRVVERYGRVNGERRIETGSEVDPVVGNLGGDGVQAVIADKDHFKVKTTLEDKRPLQPIHDGAIQFEQLSDSSFCAGCHQVVVQPGIGLEIVYQQYRQGPACKKGVSCQDCHMGAVPGKALGYTYGPAAEVDKKTIHPQRKHANHVFYGPAYPLAHPGLFPHNEKSFRWKPDQWLQFDHRQGWGTKDFEDWVARNPSTYAFPDAWKLAQERIDARKVIDENQKLLDYKRQTAVEILENGSQINGPLFSRSPAAGKSLDFHYVVCNTSEGHNMPSGSLGAQPQLWLNVVLIDPQGNRIWESGDLDSNGDLRDLHSLDVRAGRIQRDPQLKNFQTKFLITNIKGTEREMYLPVNVDIDPLPFFRPGTVPYTVLNHPPFIRMEAHSIPPLDSRTAKYSVPAELLTQKGTYRLSVRLRSRVEPPYFLLFCDGTPDMLTSLNEAILDVHPYSTEFTIR
ncbi:multiheme c-type cytochrome [Pirellulaceae bacterium SH467]